MDFLNKLKNKWNEGKFVCVGLDRGIFEFDKTIIDQTADLVCAYKLQSAFYEASGVKGWDALKKSVDYIKQTHPDLLIILDAKRGDIDTTNEAYAKAIFDDLGVDSTTVHPYLGEESLQPFLNRKDKGIFVLVRTSNPGAGEFQTLQVYPERSLAEGGRSRRGKPFYQIVAEHVKSWDINENIGVVAGATYPEELKKVREIVHDCPILVPGIGSQGGDLKAVLLVGLDSKKQGLIISSSRSIIFAPNPREATQRLHTQIQEILQNV